MTLVAHATGNANVRAVISGLHAAGLLAEFHTSIATFPHSIWARCAQFWWGREFHRRAFDARLQPATIQHPFRELGRMGATRLNLKQLTKHETGWFSVDAVFRALDRDIARRLAAACLGKLGTVYAYEDGALATFQAAKQRGIKCCYDLPIAYWQTAQTLLAQEAERLPEWEPTLGGRRDSAAKLERKAAELALADAVFCPSDFVANSLPAWVHQDKRVSVLPFGSPPGHSRPHSPQTASRPLRVLFAGSLTQRKGACGFMCRHGLA
jgi:hypothetical protein